MSRPFRFGVVAPVLSDVASWLDQLRRLADSGYSTVLMPDVPQWQPAPGPTLAMAAARSNLRVGTWVYASPLRPAWRHPSDVKGRVGVPFASGSSAWS